jgi:hypothetical protein
MLQEYARGSMQEFSRREQSHDAGLKETADWLNIHTPASQAISVLS